MLPPSYLHSQIRVDMHTRKYEHAYPASDSRAREIGSWSIGIQLSDRTAWICSTVGIRCWVSLGGGDEVTDLTMAEDGRKRDR